MNASEPRTRPWWLPPDGRLHWSWWIALTALLLWAEHVTGAHTQFPMGYVIPVSLAAWYSGRWPALALAVAVPLAHLTFMTTTAGGYTAPVAIATFRGTVIGFMALWFARLADHERELRREVHALKGLLSICSYCKSIRNESGKWEQLERFISRRSETQFSHGLCPSCQEIHFPDLAETESA